jgi:hypothetical protein
VINGSHEINLAVAEAEAAKLTDLHGPWSLTGYRKPESDNFKYCESFGTLAEAYKRLINTYVSHNDRDYFFRLLFHSSVEINEKC